MKDEKLEQILNEVSGVFDYAYENSDTDADREYINEVEAKLYNYLTEKGLI
jgi:hypothetical protein